MPHPPTVPPVIPDYTLLTLIGQGSYGDVWLAQGITGPHRAIKVIWRNRFADETPYLSELRGLRHFAGISLLEAGQLALLHVGYNETAGFLYYVMEAADDAGGGPIHPATYVPNTLAEALRRRDRTPAAQALAIAASLARGLAGLHARGLVHRDIKPSNIIFVAGVAKLADIGTIGTIGAIAAEHAVAGTPGYAPLEGPGTTAADVFSLGKVIYEIAMGLGHAGFPRLPPDFDTWPDRVLLLELNEIIAKACDPSPSRRHPDGSSLLDEIRSLKAGRSVRTQRRRSHTLLVGTLGLTATLVFASFALLPATVRAQRRRHRESYQNALGRATLALELDDPSRARQELLAARAAAAGYEPRGVEWYALWNDTMGRTRRLETGATPALDPRHALGISRDGRRLAVTGPGPVFRLFSAGSLEPITTAGTSARSAGFLPDDSILAWSDTGTVHLWNDQESLTEIARLGMGPNVRILAMASDGSLFAAASATGALEIRAIRGSRLRHTFLAHPDSPITGLAVSPRGEWVATVDETRRLRLWKTESGLLQAEMLAPAGVRALVFEPGAGRIALALESGSLELRRTSDLERVGRITPGGAGAYALAFDPQGRRLIAGEATGVLSVYSTTDWSEVARFPAGPGRSPIQSLVFSGDGQVLAAQRADGSLRVWTLTDRSP